MTPEALEALIRDTEKLLRDTTEALSSGRLSRSAAAQASAGQAPPRPAREEQSVDGSAEVRISEDGMTASCTFRPAMGAGKPIRDAEMEELLASRGVQFGIDWDVIKSSLVACSASHKALAGIEIAHGRRPVAETGPRLEIEPALRAHDSGFVPMGETDEPAAPQSTVPSPRRPFRLVKKGTVLAWVSPGVQGMAGIDVTGVVVNFGKAPRASPKPGANTLIRGGAVVAACDGRFVMGDGSFQVREVLEIPGDVDAKTGNVSFAGDIFVHGQIRRGFTVKAGGSLTCAKLIDASEIQCGEDLETGQGVLGRMQGRIKVGGRVRARFIENCTVEAGGDVFVETGCLGSSVNSLGSVSTGPRGMIIGGKIFAQGSVFAWQLGSSAAIRTEVHCGVDYRVQHKLAWIRDRSGALAVKLNEVEATLAHPARRTRSLLLLRTRLRTAILKMNDVAKSLISSLDKDEGADVRASGTIHKGVFVNICQVPFVVERPLTGTRFALDKSAGVVFPED